MNEEILQEIIEAGYTGNATKEDWLKLMDNNGGTVVFGSEAEQNRIAETETGNVELFCQWYLTYKQ